MRFLMFVLVLIIFSAGCVDQTAPSGNDTNQSSNQTEPWQTPPVCSGKVCGRDGITYDSDCQAQKANVSILYAGECVLEENCTDSDGGENPKEAGIASKSNESKRDICVESSNLIEYVCINNSLSELAIQCDDSEKCEEGKCVPRPAQNITPPPSGCTGPTEADVYSAHNVSFNGLIYNDTCVDFTTVKDYYCKDNKAEAINNQCPPGYGCIRGQCEKQLPVCTETDGGKNITLKGDTKIVKGLGTTYSGRDECIDIITVLEHFCLENNSAASEEIDCGSGYKCVAGRCITGECSETDRGQDIYRRGITTAGELEYQDECTSDYTVNEYYCYADEIRNEVMQCGKGYICNADKCVEGEISSG